MKAYSGSILANPGKGDAHIIIYGYTPSLVLGLFGFFTFLLATCGNCWWFWRAERTRKFHFLMSLGCLLEALGYAARINGHYNPFRIVSFILQYFLIVIAPVAFTAAVYLVLTMMANRCSNGAAVLPLRPKIILIVFVSFDILTTIIQIAGASMVGSAQSDIANDKTPKINPDAAAHILLAGLVVQTASFLTFLSILGLALRRAIWLAIGDRSVRAGTRTEDQSMRDLLLVALGTALLLLLRTAYRLAAEAQGYFAFLNTHEYLFGILEYAPVILAIVIWLVFPPTKFLDAEPGSQEFLEEHQLTIRPPKDVVNTV